jgi:hypothetical protein
MEILIGIALFLGLTIAIVLILRWIGAWMLRIDEVITQLKKINEKLNK